MLSHFLWPDYDTRELDLPGALQKLDLLEGKEAEELTNLRKDIWELEEEELKGLI